MANFISKSLKGKLIVSFLFISLIPIAIVGYISYSSGKTALRERLFNSLITIAKSRETAVNVFLEGKQGRVIDFASDGFIRDNLIILDTMGVSVPGNRRDVVEEINNHLIKNKMPLDADIYGINVTDLNGRVIASTVDSEIELDESQTGYFTETMKLNYGECYVGDISISNHFGVETEAFTASAPLTDRNSNERLGVIVNYYKASSINKITISREGLGETGEVYIVNKEGYMITDSRFLNNAVLKQRVNTDPVRLFQTQRKTMTGVYPDYRGVPVVGSSMGDEIDKKLRFGWTILAEIDASEAFAPVRTLGMWIICVTGPIILIVVFIAWLIARGVANPIKRISENVVKVGGGDLTVDIVKVNRADEIGNLIEAFRDMVANLRRVTLQVKEGVNVLGSAASEILASTSQLASSASETAAAVNETTATAEEVKQTAQVSSQKARVVSDMANKAAEVSQAGKRAADNIIGEMDRIREQIGSVAESIVRLSEQSQSIGEIIAMVDDLAEQSNLLAVNAAIEAAKAGEHGRGFTVVAQEVRSLADQSKQATAQVKNILTEIQKATSAAVMAAEQGSKAVESGARQSEETGRSIEMLTNSITEAAHAGRQIAVSSQEQLTGMDQVVSAIENIKNASVQSADSTKQLETAARNLDELGKRLKVLSERYKV